MTSIYIFMSILCVYTHITHVCYVYFTSIFNEMYVCIINLSV